jgi:hypothetical protein
MFARRVFLLAGLLGLAALLPVYFLEGRIGRDQPPAINHPEFFYFFLGTAVTWQVVFLVISRDPVRFRPLMLTAVLVKATIGVPALILFAAGRVAVPVLLTGVADLILGLLFFIAFLRTKPAAESRL